MNPRSLPGPDRPHGPHRPQRLQRLHPPRRPARAAALALALPALAALVAGCPEPDVIEVDPAKWESRVDSGPEEMVVTDQIEVGAAGVEQAKLQLMESARRRAVLLAAKDILRDDDLYQRHQAELEKRLADQFQQYVSEVTELERATLDGGKRLATRVRVRVARDKVSKLLQEEGILRLEQMRVIVIVKRPDPTATDVSPVADGYQDDLAQVLAQELVERGLRPKLWNDVRAALAERRDDLDQDLERFLVQFVEDSDWRRPEDDRYELPMIVLRSQGRLLVGFRVLELAKKELAYHATMRVDAYDLFKGESIAFDTLSGRAVIGNRTLKETRQQLVTDTARQLARRLGAKVEELISRERRLRKNHYRLVFEGYDEREVNRLESLLAGVIAEDLDPRQDGARLVVEADLAYEPIPLRDEIARTIKRFGLGSKTPKRTGNELVFAKE